MISLKPVEFVMILLIGAGGMAMAQATPPPLINYQGVLRDTSTGLPLSSTVDMVFTLYPDAGSSGTDILSDTHTGVVVSGGLFSVQLGGGVLADGGGSGTYGSLSDLFRDFSEVWMQIRVGSETLSPRVRVAGAPYAMNAAHLEGKTAAQFLDTSATSQSKAGALTVGSLTSSGAINTGSLTVTNPINATGGLVLPSGSALQFPDGIASLSGRSPMQIATLHWYDAGTPIPYDVGTNPEAVAFDGFSIIVVNNSSNTVTMLRGSDGAVVGGGSVGTGPIAVAFDGSNSWVVNFWSNNVTKLQASGATVGTFPVGTRPRGVAFDGSSVWVTNSVSNDVTRLRATDGANLGTFPVGASPQGAAFDGSSIWVTNLGGNSVTKLQASDGTNLGTFPVGTSPIGVAFDGSSIWVVNSDSNNVTKLRPSDGTTLGTFPVGSGPHGVAFDGSSIWVTNTNSNSVTKLRAADGTNLGTFPVPLGPLGVAFDGSSIWVTNYLYHTVSKL